MSQPARVEGIEIGKIICLTLHLPRSQPARVEGIEIHIKYFARRLATVSTREG